MLRKTGAKKWHCALVDVKIASLLAPWREAESKLLTLCPPKIIQEAGIVGPDEGWVENFMYGFEIEPFKLDQLQRCPEDYPVGLQWAPTTTAGDT